MVFASLVLIQNSEQTSTSDVVGLGKGRLSDAVAAAQISTEFGRGFYSRCVGNYFPRRLDVLIDTNELEIIDAERPTPHERFRR